MTTHERHEVMVQYAGETADYPWSSRCKLCGAGAEWAREVHAQEWASAHEKAADGVRLPRTQVTGHVRVRGMVVVAKAVDAGVARGLALAQKHTDRPTVEALTVALNQGVMAELDAVLTDEEAA